MLVWYACVLIVGKDKLVYEIHDLVLGKKSKVVEITYERKK